MVVSAHGKISPLAALACVFTAVAAAVVSGGGGGDVASDDTYCGHVRRPER